MTGRLARVLALAAMLALWGAPATRAYTPGSGTLLTENFNDGNDAGWQTVGTLSKWTVANRGGSPAYVADGAADLFRGLPETSVRRLIAVPVGSVDLCFGMVAGAGPAWSMTWELRPPRDDAPFYRLAFLADGSIEARLVDAAGAETLVAAAPSRIVPGTPAWIRLRLRPGAAGATDVSLRAWGGGAAAEPGTWDATGTTPGPDGIPYIERAQVACAQPAGGETWVDEIDIFGDTSAGVLSTIKTVWIVEASHLDIGFTAPPADIEAFAKTHLDQVMTNLRTVPEYRWTIENAWQLLRFIERSTPAQIREAMDFLREGRLSLSAGYANLHTTVTSREEMIRALSHSQAIARAEGFESTTYIQDDVPGGTWALPELMRRAGVTHYLGGMNCSFGGVITAPSHATRPFWWEGPDGSRVLSWITFDSYAEGLGEYGLSFFDTPATMHPALGAGLGMQEGLGYPHENLLVMRVFDNHYQGLHVRNLVNQWNARYRTPILRLATPREFWTAIEAEIAASGWTIPTHRGDYGGAWSSVIPGTAHTQAAVNVARRDVQAAEGFCAAAATVGAPHPTADIDRAWRLILDVDEHSGGGLPWPGIMTEPEATQTAIDHQTYAIEARDLAARALASGMEALSRRVDLPRGGIVAWNAQDAARTGPVSARLPAGLVPGSFRLIDMARGEEIAYQQDPADASAILFLARDVEPRGFGAFETRPGAPRAAASDLVVTATTIENAFYRVTVDSVDGSVASIVHLPSGRELVDASSPFRFGQAAWNTNTNAFWGVTPTIETVPAARVSPGATGPVMASLLVERDGTPAASMEIRLHAGLDRIEVASVFDRSRVPYVPVADHSRLYALTYPLALTNFDFATESPARLLRPATDGFARDGLFAQLNTTACLDVQDAAGGVILASPETMVSEWGGISANLGAHRTGAATWFLRVKSVADEAEFEGGIVGPMDDEPGLGPLYPATVLLRASGPSSEAAVRRAGHDLVDPLRATWIDRGDGTWPAGGRALLACDDADARAFTLKRAADGAWVARIEDTAGAARDVRVGSLLTLANPEAASLMEVPAGPLALDAGRVVVPLVPFGTTTFRVRATDDVAPIVLMVTKDVPAAEVVLTWTGGKPAYRVLGSLRADVSGDTRVLDARAPATTLRDAPAYPDGQLWFYQVR